MAEDSASSRLHEGGCLCGQVRYAVHGQPWHVTNCYCRFCQRATGSTHMFEPVWPKQSLRLLSGSPAVYALRSARSGKEVLVHFCAGCGTKLYLAFERFPDAIGVYGGTLDNPAAAVGEADQTAIFLDEAPKGAVIPAGMKTWRQHKFTNDGDPIEPSITQCPFIV